MNGAGDKRELPILTVLLLGLCTNMAAFKSSFLCSNFLYNFSLVFSI